jgi:hypothetical protein
MRLRECRHGTIGPTLLSGRDKTRYGAGCLLFAVFARPTIERLDSKASPFCLQRERRDNPHPEIRRVSAQRQRSRQAGHTLEQCRHRLSPSRPIRQLVREPNMSRPLPSLGWAVALAATRSGVDVWLATRSCVGWV